jgi:uncharacterized protein YjbI with pentapeptide repeats
MTAAEPVVAGSLDSPAAEGSCDVLIWAATTYAHRVSRAERSPKLPRVPEGLTTVSGRSLDDEAAFSDIVLGGDFGGQQYEDVVFERCRIANAAFTGSQLHLLHLTDVVVENADLSGADLDESSFNRVQFRHCRMSAVTLTRCRLVDVSITDCRLDHPNLRMSHAKSVTFEDVDLSNGDFYAAVLENTKFFDCNLTASEFSKAKMEQVRFHGSNLLDLKGGQYLGGSVIETSQVLSVALGVLSALNVLVDDDRETAEKRH